MSSVSQAKRRLSLHVCSQFPPILDATRKSAEGTSLAAIEALAPPCLASLQHWAPFHAKTVLCYCTHKSIQSERGKGWVGKGLENRSGLIAGGWWVGEWGNLLAKGAAGQYTRGRSVFGLRQGLPTHAPYLARMTLKLHWRRTIQDERLRLGLGCELPVQPHFLR